MRALPRLALGLAVVAGCYLEHASLPEANEVGVLAGPRTQRLKVDPGARRFVFVESGSLYGCAGEATDELLDRYRGVVRDMWTTPPESTDCFGFAIDHWTEERGFSPIRCDDTLERALDLYALAAAAAGTECSLVAEPSGVLVTGGGGSRWVTADGRAGDDLSADACGRIDAATARALLARVALDSRGTTEPSGDEAEVWALGDPVYGDLGGATFAPSVTTVAELDAAVRAGCGRLDP